jgi:CRP/FNR family transcriptional regulator
VQALKGDLITALPALAGVPAARLSRVLAEVRPLSVGAGRYLFRAGDPCQGFAALGQGTVRVSVTAASGREIVLYRVRPRDLCAITMSCLLGEVPYPADGMAEDEVQAFLIPRPLFAELYDELSSFRAACHRQFATRLTEVMALLAQVAFGTTAQRLASLLSQRAPRVEATHEDLATELGTSREVVTRALKHLEQRGLVHTHRGWVEVVDAPALERLASGAW